MLLAVPLLVLLAIGTPLNLAYSLLVWLPPGAAAWEAWAGLGELWLYIGIIAAYCAAVAAVMRCAGHGGRRRSTA